MGFVAYDLVDISPYYDSYFELVNLPKNVHYEALGYESQYMLRNFGSAFLFIALNLVYAIPMSLIACCFKNKENWLIRKAHETRKSYFWNTPITTLNEAFLILLVTSDVNI
jgi:hypothetical protein